MIRRSIAVLLLGFSLMVQAGTPTPQQQLQQFLNNTQSLSATFQQKLVDIHGFILQQSAGNLYLSRPGRFRWDYIQPYVQNIISNGQTIWMYDSELEQVNVRPYNQLMAASPVRLLDNQQPLDKVFRLEPLSDEDDQQWVQLTPLESESDFKHMTVGLQAGKIKTMRFTDNFNQQTEIQFDQMIVNPHLKPEHFEFVAPEGTDVMGGN